MTTALVTEAQAKAADDVAQWALSNAVHLGGRMHPDRADAATIEATHRALRAAQAMHRAARIEKDVGRFSEGTDYAPVYFAAIREFVTLGYDHSPEEPGDDEQPTIGETLDITEVWLRGVEITALTDAYIDDLQAALEKAAKNRGAL
jgi:hypothetical protein